MDYTYSYPGPDFPALLAGVLPSTSNLKSGVETQIAEPLIGLDCGVTPGQCTFSFANPLPPADEATLDAIVAAETGVDVNASLAGTLKVPDFVVASDVPWETIEAIITTPTFFNGDLAKLLARIIGEHKGDGGEMRVVEEVDGMPDAVMGTILFPDTIGSWQKYKFDTSVPPRPGLRNIYRIEARRNGAAALEFRWGSISSINTKTATVPG